MIDAATIEALARDLRGQVVAQGDAGYDEARTVWNGMIDRRPALIARCHGTADVVRAVRFAREHDVPFTVRGGGHGVAGLAVRDGAMMIDLSPMNAVWVDPRARRARVGAGATWRDFDDEAQAFGLATTGGTDSRTGVAGLTLGGGLGFLARTHGIAADNLISADVVLADGRVVRADEGEHPDLIWALRGGGGNFGIVTSFEFRLHEVGPDLLTAQVFHPFEHVREVLRHYRDFMAAAPDEVSCMAVILRVPPVAPFPQAFHGSLAVALVAAYSGSTDSGAAHLEPLRTFGEPILAAVSATPYVALQQSFDAGTPDGGRYYFKSRFLAGLSDDAIDTIIERIEPFPGAFTVVGFEPMGGAINRVPTTATSFPHRSSAFNFSVFAGWIDREDDDSIIGWARGFDEAMAPHASGGRYLNYLGTDDADKTQAATGGNYERLREVKATYDPDDVFDMNHKIRPKQPEAAG